MPIYELALIEKEDTSLTLELGDEGVAGTRKKERLLVPPTTIMAPNYEVAKAQFLLKHTKDIGDYAEDLIEVQGRRFYRNMGQNIDS